MNGFISSQRLRLTLSLTTCLLGGFHYGMNFGDQFDLFKFDQKINIAKISWIIRDSKSKQIDMTPIEYPKISIVEKKSKELDGLKHPAVKKIVSDSSIKKENSRELAKAIVKVASPESIEDFQIATKQMHESMLSSLTQEPSQAEQVTISVSSANPFEQKNLESDLKIVLGKPDQILALNDFEYRDTMNIQMLDIQNPVLSSDRPTMNSENLESENDLTASENQSESAADQNDKIGEKLENNLLNQYIENQNDVKQAIQSKIEEHQKAQAAIDDSEIEEQAFTNPNDSDSSGCKDIPKIKLVKPVDLINGENNQICPTRKNWISKNNKQSGWVRLEVEGHFPVLVYYPQPSSEQVLMMDDNSVALMAIKAGVRYSSEAGMIMGTVPTGYKVDFSGKTDEIQYLEINSKKYFFLLNVDPGAGVIELVSEKDQNEVSSVFVPVLKGTISFLSLSEPTTSSLKIIVEKDGSKKADLSGLNVSLSAQTQIYSVTDEKGKAILKDVKIIKDYPIYLDVDSKINGSRGYQYRFELQSTLKDGTYKLKQFSEKKLHQWLKQFKGKINSQSGLIVGEYSRKKMGGFKNHYYPKTVNLIDSEIMKSKTMTILWDEQLSDRDPLEGDHPRFLSAQVPEGLTQLNIINDNNKIVQSSLIPVSPRVINVITE